VKKKQFKDTAVNIHETIRHHVYRGKQDRKFRDAGYNQNAVTRMSTELPRMRGGSPDKEHGI
jgi:hypothetical protein